MPVVDPIADLLTRMRNAQHARSNGCLCPWSKHKEEMCTVLKNAGYLQDVWVKGEGKDKTIEVAFSTDHPAMTIKRVSTPGRRVYAGKDSLKPVLRGFGIAVLTTSLGLMTDAEAREKGVGGEVLCTVS